MSKAKYREKYYGKTGPSSGERWSDVDIAFMHAYDDWTAYQLALALGRSIKAVEHMRAKLRKREINN